MGESVAWSSEQMLENATQWSLAGDVAILNRLKRFSKTVISSAESLNEKVDNMLNNLENVGLRLELTKNEFHSLRNTQFIENRVYEDDETLDNEEPEPVKQEPTEEDKENAIIRSISKGLEVMKKYYEKVEVAVSDSEDETNEKSYVWQPKDLYAHRRLPYLVGTDEWHKHWHVGLLSSESESEVEKEDPEEEEDSDSDSEKYLPKNRNLESETSSELDIHNNAGPVANSTFNDSLDDRREIIHSSDETSDQSNSAPVKTPLSQENFAEQLAAKLGNVISGQSHQPNTGTKPKVRQEHTFGRIFADEPPPLDDTLLPTSSQAVPQFKDRHRDLFAEDSDDELFWNPSQKSNRSPDRNVPVSTTQSSSDTFKSSSKKPRGLFDSSESLSDEDMISATEKKQTILKSSSGNPYMTQPNKSTVVPFIDDQPPEIVPEHKSSETTKKKPTGGVSILGPNVDIFGEKGPMLQPKRATSSKLVKKDSLFDELSDEETFLPKTTFDEPKKVVNLFDNADKIADNAKQKETDKKVEPAKEYGAVSKKAVKKISLFDDDDDDFLKEEEDIFSFKASKGDLFGTKSLEKGLFDDLEDDLSPKEVGLFQSLESTNEKDASISSYKEEETPTKLIDNNEKPTSLNKSDNDLVKEEVKSVSKPSSNSSLFSKYDIDDDYNIFSTKTREEIVKKVDKEPEQANIENYKSTDSLPKDVSKAEENDAKITRTPEKSLSEVDIVRKQEVDTKSSQIENKNEFLKKMRKSVGYADSDGESSDLDSKNDQISEAGLIPDNVKKQEDQETTQEETVDIVMSQPEFEPPPINLYDPTPPPLDWDATSDNSVESDRFSISDGLLDRGNYDQSEPTVSSLFDEAPPSLHAHDINYSSGIGRDINVTRPETDESFFIPYASSSRRLSSDIFNEQQSQDSFFVTKNQTENQSNLNRISETSEESASKIENLTPSGRMTDFEGSDSVFDNSTSNEIDEGMARNPPALTPKPNILQKLSLFDATEKERNNENFKKSPISLPKGTGPGKLKHNLNINIEALLPGAAPSRNRPSEIKSLSPDETDDLQFDVDKSADRLDDGENFETLHKTEVLPHVTKDRAKIPIKRRPSTRKARLAAIRKSTHSDLYDEDVTEKTAHETDNNLNNEATPILVSDEIETPELNAMSLVFDDNKEEDDPISKSDINSDKLASLFDNLGDGEDIFKPMKESSQLFDSDDGLLSPDLLQEVQKQTYSSKGETSVEEPLFSTQKESKDLPETSSKKHTTSLFGASNSDSESDSELFSSGSNTVKKISLFPHKVEKKPASSSLFSDRSDSDGESDLFGKSKGVKAAMEQKKTNLFGDSGSEEDLFGNKNDVKSVESSAGNLGSKKAEIKNATIKNLQNKEVTEFDPLSEFQ